MTSIKVAAIQLNANEDIELNVKNARILCENAAKENSVFIVLPEMFHYRPIKGRGRYLTESEETKILEPFICLAAKYKVFILAGSISESIKGSKKKYNTSVLINDMGEIQEKYQKMHLFDAVVSGENIHESRNYDPGLKPKVTDLKGFKLGMSICFDCRFSSLYDYYRKEKVDIITLPASFTSYTGKAHWEVLCRARAIETQSYVIAPNQFGEGVNGIETYGHSMIVDPWGHVITVQPKQKEAILYATLDKKMIDSVRKKILISTKE